MQANVIRVWLPFLKRSPLQALLSAIGAIVLVYWAFPILEWLFFKAQFSGQDRSACDGEGACWVFVRQRFSQFIFGFYEPSELWRPLIVAGAWVFASVPWWLKKFPYRIACIILTLPLLPWCSWMILQGGWLGLVEIETVRWGGLMLTLFISAIGMTLSLPIGILLALGRRSTLPLIRWLATAFIELWRGVPLITVLFMASVMLPLFLAPGTEIDKLLRCLIGVVCFTSAYMAEVVRSGLNAVGQGQHEAASALGLGYWRSMSLVIMPQALRLVIPNIVNSFISLFKDTSLVLVIGMFDLLGMVQAASTDSEWLGYATEGYVFAGFIFWLFCFSMSRTSLRLERRLQQHGQR